MRLGRAMTRSLQDRIAWLTDGLGVDAVIIAAATLGTDPINFAGQIARQKGRVVIVGDVPTGFERESYYRKELDLRMSCSHGPGRYDPTYEEHGIDYPPAYVRWSEQRNMQAFQDLTCTGRIDVGCLTTHEFPLENAQQAYDIILKRTERFFGILLRYDAAKPLPKVPIRVGAMRGSATASIAFIGAGSYAQGSLLPNLPNDQAVVRRAVVTTNGTTSKRVAEKFRFEYCTSDAGDVLNSTNIDCVFIATRHDSHARYVADALRAGKRVFVEKPVALTEDELGKIDAAYHEALERGGAPVLMVGFNRRFSEFAKAVRRALGNGPMAMMYRVNAGAIPNSHWIQDPLVGGGRIIGEACHFIDLLTFFCGALPVRVFASAFPNPVRRSDIAAINLEFADGSVGTVCYYANGSRSFDKEYVEIHTSGNTAVIRDFRTLELGLGDRIRKTSLRAPDKGQRAMMREFVEVLKLGGPSPVPFEQVCAVARASFAAVRSIREHKAIAIEF